ncbi:unnamed protein product [Effrenium voratum]|uniref:PKD/REJ-like domain-containing protein n=1 Tax=Effrenium voratum TaxID=2562239 RepID=A0AA36HRS5_9DINO|nr:unnamed protein product [Effrenium voratum]
MCHEGVMVRWLFVVILLQTAASDVALRPMQDAKMSAPRDTMHLPPTEVRRMSEAEEDANSSNYSLTSSSTATTTTSLFYLAAEVSGYVRFAARDVNREGALAACEAALSETLGIAAWQLNTTAELIEDATWHVSYSFVVDGDALVGMLQAARATAADTSEFTERLRQMLVHSESFVAGSLQMVVFADPHVEEVDVFVLNSTSTTKTSVTHTSTTTTQTRLVNLVLESAVIQDPFLSVKMHFNRQARFVGQSDASGCYAGGFPIKTWQSFGHSPRCHWVDPETLEIFFGRAATLAPGEMLYTALGGFEPSGNVVWSTVPSLSTQVVAEGAVEVSPALFYPRTALSCSRVTISAEGSVGGVHRPLEVTWFINPPTFDAVREALQGAVDAANAERSRVLQFSPIVWSNAIQILRVIFGEISYFKIPVHVNITAQVSNWLHAATNISGTVTLSKQQESMPELLPLATELQVSPHEEVNFEVTTRPTNMTGCVGTVAANVETDVQIEWEYRPSGFGVNLPWLKLSGLRNLTDNSKAPNMISFASNSFAPNTHHQFRALASYKIDVPPVQRPNVTFNLTIRPSESPAAIIAGPSEVGVNCSFTLNASQSMDVSMNNPLSDLIFLWTCDASMACDLFNFAAENQHSTDGTGASGKVMHVMGGQLEEGDYVFRVAVRRRTEPIASAGNASINVRVTAGLQPAITLLVPWAAGGRVSLQASDLLVHAVVEHHHVCTWPEEWIARFALVEHSLPHKILTFLQLDTESTTTTSSTSTTSTSSTTSTTSTLTFTSTSTTTWDDSYNQSDFDDDGWLNKSYESNETDIMDFNMTGHFPGMRTQTTTTTTTLPDSEVIFATRDFHGNLLLAGVMYSYAILLGDAAELLAWEDNATHLGDILASSLALVAVSEPFHADAPPAHGLVLLEPVMGEAASTIFTISTTDWQDERESAMQYAFYSFPVSGSLTSDFEDPIKRRGLELGYVEWDDSSHPQFWRARGGVELRTFSSAKSMEVMLGAGVFFVLARARDDLQAYAESFLAGPMVSAPDSFDKDAAMAFLDVARSSNEASRMINAVEAIASLAELVPSSEKTAMVLEALAFLEGATRLDSTASMVRMCAGSAARLIRGTADAAVLRSATLAIASSLDNALTIDVPASRVVLESILEITTANAQNQGGAAAAVSSEVQTAGLKLGGSFLAALLPGETQTLTWLDAGRGTELRLGKLGLVAGRRLAAAFTCESQETDLVHLVQPSLLSLDETTATGDPDSALAMDLQDTWWHSTNLYAWADPNAGVNSFVPQDASVRSFQVTLCGTVVTFSSMLEPLNISLVLPPLGTPPLGYFFVPACAKWDEGSNSWRSEGLTVMHQSGLTLLCQSLAGAGSYVAFYAHEALPTTTTTSSTLTLTSLTTTSLTQTTSTATGPSTSTATTFTVTTTTVLWGMMTTSHDGVAPHCSQTLLPDLPPGAAAFSCYGPRRVGQECRAKCDPMSTLSIEAAVTCGSDLNWAVSVLCPAPTESW